MSPDQQLTAYLRDAHAIEEQALVQMRIAPALAGATGLHDAFREHARETRDHARLVADRLQAGGSGPSRARDLVAAGGGLGFALFAAVQPDTPGKLAAHAYSYEHLELGGYEVLRQVADRAGDQAAVEVAERVAAQEEAMGRRIAGCFDETTDAALRQGRSSDLRSRLKRYLQDAYALEGQARALLSRARSIGGERLRAVYEEHLRETEEHRALVRERLRAQGAGPSMLKDTALRIGAVNWGLFFQLQPGTPAKLAVFAFAFEHLEIAGYEQLQRVALRAEDEETAAVARRITAQEQAAAAKIRGALGEVTDAVLEGRTG